MAGFIWHRLPFPTLAAVQRLCRVRSWFVYKSAQSAVPAAVRRLQFGQRKVAQLDFQNR